MENVSTKKYVQLFYIILQLKNKLDLNLNDVTQEDKNYLIALAYLLDKKQNVFNFNYEILDGVLYSKNIPNSLNFINMDFEGTINELQKSKVTLPVEKFTLNVLEDIYEKNNFSLTDKQLVASHGLITYFKDKGFKNFGDAKKYIVKEKIENVDLDNLKALWKHTPNF